MGQTRGLRSCVKRWEMNCLWPTCGRLWKTSVTLIPRELPHDAGTLERLVGEPRPGRWFGTRKDASRAGFDDTRLNHILPVVNVLPITSRKHNRRIYPNEAQVPAGTAGLDVESIVLCYQIRTLDKQRLVKRLGVLDETNLRTEVLAALRFQLVMTQ